MTILEFDYLMERSPSESIKTYEDGDAMNQRILEWLDTPEGTVADLPAWGHPFYLFKHEPDGPTLRVVAEMLIFQKLLADVEDIDLRSVAVEFPEMDYMRIDIEHGTAFLSTEVPR